MEREIKGTVELWMNGSLQTVFIYSSPKQRKEKFLEWNEDVRPLVDTGREIFYIIKPEM